MKRILRSARVFFLTFLNFSFAIAEPASQADIEVYGKLPEFRALSISPDGKHISLIRRMENTNYFMVVKTDSMELVGGANTSNIKARGTSFLTDTHVLIWGSDTTSVLGSRIKFESTGAIVFNIETGKSKLLLKGTKDIHPAQTGVGKIVGFDPEDEVLYMPAFADSDRAPYNLYKVNIDTGRGRLYERGNSRTLDWFMGENGRVLAREEFDEKDQEHRIYSKITGEWQLIYTKNISIPEISISAVSLDEQKLIFVAENGDREAIYEISLLDGSISGPVFSRPNTDVEYLDTNLNGKLKAVVYSGFTLGYEFIDKELKQPFEFIENSFPDNDIEYLSSTSDKKRMLVKISGANAAGSYYLLDTQESRLTLLASSYNVSAIAEISILKYKSRDGLSIPSILTSPPGLKEKKNLPLIALPHGGPEAYDAIGFDWIAQYLAIKGYVVLQPNYRGSTGFGYKFRDAGRGKWGREMQNDVTDGITALAEAGYIDPKRVCIIGASYGGYSALAGGAFTPDLYKCVVSINGLSDIPSMLRSDKYKYGHNHWVVSYWKDVIGDSNSERDKLEAISPVNFAAEFQAPVLLIHGRDDTVVPIGQSRAMEKALKKADKEVKLVKLKGEDHWLSTSEARLATLEAIDSFLNKHNPVN